MSETVESKSCCPTTTSDKPEVTTFTITIDEDRKVSLSLSRAMEIYEILGILQVAKESVVDKLRSPVSTENLVTSDQDIDTDAIKKQQEQMLIGKIEELKRDLESL